MAKDFVAGMFPIPRNPLSSADALTRSTDPLGPPPNERTTVAMPQSAPVPDDVRQLHRPVVGRAAAASCAAPAWPGSALGAPALLSACGTQAAKQTAELLRRARTCPSSQKTLHFSNWPLYIDEKKVKRGGKKVTVYPTLEEFEKQTGIKVDYVTDVNDNSEFFGDRPQPARRLPAHRPRHHVADRLDGRPDGQPRLAAEARQVQPAQRRGEPGGHPQVARAGTRTATTRCRGRAA